MFMLRDLGELYLQGGSMFGQKEGSHGWVEQLDPVSLEPIRRSPDLPSGGTTGVAPRACTKTATST